MRINVLYCIVLYCYDDYRYCEAFQSLLEQVRVQNNAIILGVKHRLTCKHHVQICGGQASYRGIAHEMRVCITFMTILHE